MIETWKLVVTLAAAALCPNTAPQAAIEVRLRCDDGAVVPGRPLECVLTLETQRDASLVIAPRALLPFDIKRWPRARVQFELSSPAGSQLLTPSEDAQQEFDLPLFGERSAIILAGGDVYGFIYDLNGADWKLPPLSGRAQLRAHVEIDLLQRDPRGRLFPGVSHYLKGHETCAENVALRGSWYSNWVTIEKTR